MPTYSRGDVALHYEESGNPQGFPILLIAPGGMRSAVDFWDRVFPDPRAVLGDRYRIIAMDQRNAGASTGPIEADHGWHTYTGDQLALIDHLGIDEFGIVGMCIGGPYIMGLIRAAGARVRAAAMFQPIGLHENRTAFVDMFEAWRAEVAPRRPEATPELWDRFRHAMFEATDFMFNTTREQAAGCTTPIALFRGNDLYHPAETSDELSGLLPNVQFVKEWKTPEHHAAAVATLQEFFSAQLPA